MTALLLALLAVVGLAVGSFLNVVVWRVPRGESVVTPASHCPACDAAVRSRDNVPVVSWLLLRGRCRDCRTPIAARYPLVEASTALVFVVLGARLGASWELPAFLYLGAVGVALALIDLDVKRLPDVLVLPSYAVALALLALPALLDHRWPDYGRAVLGGVVLYAGYFVLAYAYPAGMGFGDVKLAGVLGIYLGWLGWGSLAAGAFLGFLLGGVVGVALLASARATRKTAIPYGPFMLLGALLAVLAGGTLARAYLDVMGI